MPRLDQEIGGFTGSLLTVGGRKPPLMAEVGQSILREHSIDIVQFMPAKDLRGLQGCTSGREPAKLFVQESLDNAVFPVRWA